jgi:hypothetical protein
MALKFIEGNERFKFEVYNPGATEFYTILGITNGRADELEEMVKSAYRQEELFSDSIALVVSQLTHINEVIFASMLLSRVHDQSKSKSMDRELETKLNTLKLMAELIKSSK